MEYNIRFDDSYEGLEAAFQLGEQHFNEVEEKHQQVPYNVDYQMLRTIYDTGLVRLIVCEDESEKMVGYFLSLISPDIFTSTLIAKEVGIYLDKGSRGHGLFKVMLEMMEEELTLSGVKTNLISFKEGHEHTTPLGYAPTERAYQKILEV